MDVLDVAPEVLAAAQVRRHRISVAEYHLMANSGAFVPDARVELIEGDILHMSPMGTRHSRAVIRLNRLLLESVGRRAQIGCQVPLRLSDFAEPEPDFCVWRLDTPEGAGRGQDTLLAIEIADSSVLFDAQVKAPLYARHGVQEYWILDLPGRCVLRHAENHEGRWNLVLSVPLDEGVALALPGLEGVVIDLAPAF
jgi:Uma2 family endonuclease